MSIAELIGSAGISDVAAVVAVGWLAGSGLLKSILRRTRKATLGPASIELDSEGNPKIWELCDQRNNAMTSKVDALANKVDGHIAQQDKNNDAIANLIHRNTDAIEGVAATLNKVVTDYSKLSFYMKDMPDSQQLAAGLEYVAAGGNGETRKDVVYFASSHIDMYEAITAVAPRLRLKEIK